MKIIATSTWTPRIDVGQFISTRVSPLAVKAAEAGGDVVLKRAQEIVHVVSGRLRDSGTVLTTDTGAAARADVIFDTPYAGTEEFRGPAAGHQHHAYLRPALDESHAAILAEFASRFKS